MKQRNECPITDADFGVTAYTLENAIELVSEAAYDNEDVPAVVDYIVDVDVSTLDPGHVRPNMGNVLKQGIWYPLGFNSYPRSADKMTACGSYTFG